MEQFLNLLPFSIEQLIAPLMALMVGLLGFWIHERMRLQHYLGELRSWASSCLDSLSEAAHLCDLDPSIAIEPNFFNRRHNVLVKLSSLIDQGRWFFPNAKPMSIEAWRLEEYTNLKQRPLDDLVYAYGAVKKMSYTDRGENILLRAPLVEIKRDFSASLQLLLDPQKAHKQFGLVMKKNRIDKR